jgi:copper chaperone CopZ
MQFAIEGMHCQKCVERVRKAIDQVQGAHAVNVEIGSATVAADASKSPLVIAALRDAGYAAHESK